MAMSNTAPAIRAFRNRADYKSSTGSLSGVLGNSLSMGQLPHTYREDLYDARDAAERAGEAIYVVYSYGTPIGWHVDGQGWRVPDYKYSVTTSNHQGILRQAV